MRLESSEYFKVLLYIILSTKLSFLDLMDDILFVQCLLFPIFHFPFFYSTLCMCIFVVKDISPKELLKFQSQRDLRETNSLIIFIISHLFDSVIVVCLPRPMEVMV